MPSYAFQLDHVDLHLHNAATFMAASKDGLSPLSLKVHVIKCYTLYFKSSIFLTFLTSWHQYLLFILIILGNSHCNCVSINMAFHLANFWQKSCKICSSFWKLTRLRLHDVVMWLQLPECFASTLYLLALEYWQSIVVVVVT